MLLIWSYLSSQDLENQRHPKWDKLCFTFKYVILLHLWAGICVQWKSPGSKCLDHSLVGGAKCSPRLWPVTVRAWGQQLVYQVWLMDTWRFRHKGRSFPLTLLWVWQPLPIQEPRLCFCLLLSTCGISACALSLGLWAACLCSWTT